jgi:hypothetical protein
MLIFEQAKPNMISPINLKFTAILVAVTMLFVQSTSAQSTDSTLNRRAQNVFAELLGAGITVSANYDTRFGNRRDGLGGRIGAGFLSTDGDRIITIPFQLNYLLGNKGKYFEMGLGATFAHVNRRQNSYIVYYGNGEQFVTYINNDSDIWGVDGNKTSGFIGTMTFGYRYQPMNSGFSFRGYINPVFDSQNFIPYFFGLSLGYTFSSK